MSAIGENRWPPLGINRWPLTLSDTGGPRPPEDLLPWPRSWAPRPYRFRGCGEGIGGGCVFACIGGAPSRPAAASRPEVPRATTRSDSARVKPHLVADAQRYPS